MPAAFDDGPRGPDFGWRRLCKSGDWHDKPLIGVRFQSPLGGMRGARLAYGLHASPAAGTVFGVPAAYLAFAGSV